jgi:CubicO group peptidase (beta-lactamase class C family)
MITRILNAIYSFFSAVANSLGVEAATPWGWMWTEQDELGGANQDIIAHFKRYMRNEAIKAGQFALRVDGNLVMSVAFTWAEPGYRLTTPTSLMRIASCSKTFTTAAIQRLLGVQLRSDEPVFAYLGIAPPNPANDLQRPPADPRARDITVAHLVAHQGGWNAIDNPANDWVFRLRHIAQDLGLNRPPSKQEFAEYLWDRVNLDFTPGSDSKYSNIGYLLLGMVIEKATGRSYMQYLDEALLLPRGITDVFVAGTRLAQRRPTEVLYEDPFSGPDATMGPDSPALAPLPYGGMGGMTERMDSGGGLITSARTLSRFISVYNNTVNEATDTPDRLPGGRRFGGMPGTSACARSFDAKVGTRKYDYAFIFNQRDKGNKEIAAVSSKLKRFCDTLEDHIRANF